MLTALPAFFAPSFLPRYLPERSFLALVSVVSTRRFHVVTLQRRSVVLKLYVMDDKKNNKISTPKQANEMSEIKIIIYL